MLEPKTAEERVQPAEGEWLGELGRAFAVEPKLSGPSTNAASQKNAIPRQIEQSDSNGSRCRPKSRFVTEIWLQPEFSRYDHRSARQLKPR